MRNYAVLHIVIEEAKVFQTKERAPLLLCIEAFRPDEMYDDEELKKKRFTPNLPGATPSKRKLYKSQAAPGQVPYENYRSNSMNENFFDN